MPNWTRDDGTSDFGAGKSAGRVGDDGPVYGVARSPLETVTDGLASFEHQAYLLEESQIIVVGTTLRNEGRTSILPGQVPQRDRFELALYRLYRYLPTGVGLRPFVMSAPFFDAMKSVGLLGEPKKVLAWLVENADEVKL